jgi:hypothetical protein
MNQKLQYPEEHCSEVNDKNTSFSGFQKSSKEKFQEMNSAHIQMFAVKQKVLGEKK